MHNIFAAIMNIFNFDAYLFDMDGVLADTNPEHKIAYQQFLQSKQIDCSDAYFDKYIAGSNNEEVIKNILGNKATAAIINEWANAKEALFRQIYEPVLKPMPGVISFLAQLQKLNKKVAVCTSAPIENLHFLIKGLQIEQYFNIMLCEKDVTKHKPHPDVYLKALNHLNVPANKAVVFEDSTRGASAGLNAGCSVVVINNPNLNGTEFLGNFTDFTTIAN